MAKLKPTKYTAKKRTLAASINTQGGVGDAYSSTSRPDKKVPSSYERDVPDPTQGGPRKQSGARKMSRMTYASMARKRKGRRSSDAWLG